MRPKSLLLLILALGCGLIAAVGINQVLANRAADGGVDGTDTAPIFVALTDIGLGDPLTPEILKLEEWPVTKVPGGALTKLEDIEGRRARSKFYAGEPVIDAKLFARGESGSGATDLIPKGYRVVAVKVDDVSGSGLILPGDRVDVLVHVQDQPGRAGDKTTTRTFLHAVKVFAVNDVFSREANGEPTITAKTISLLVTPAQAELVTLASEMGKIRLVMRSADDDTQTDTAGVTPSELFWGKKSETPEESKPALSAADTAAASGLLNLLNQPPKPAETPAPTPPPNAWRMVLIEGTAVREIEFADGSRIGAPAQSRELSGPGDAPLPGLLPPAPADTVPPGVDDAAPTDDTTQDDL